MEGLIKPWEFSEPEAIPIEGVEDDAEEDVDGRASSRFQQKCMS